MCVAVVTSLLAQFCGAWGATLWLPPASYWPSVLLGHTHTHTHKLSLNHRHTHTYMQASTHTHTHVLPDFNFTLQQSPGADRWLSQTSRRGEGGAVGGFWDGRGFVGIPQFLIGRRAHRGEVDAWILVRMLLEGVRNRTWAHLEPL